MVITKVELIQAPELKRFLWIRIHTDDGITGLGETYIHTEPIKAFIEKVLAPEFLLGKDPLRIESLWRSMYDRVNYAGWAGAEMRAISAIDIALWDILGQHSNQPIYQLLGGKCRDRIRVYNTCGPDDDFDFMRNPAELARDLLDGGIQTMKIFPFDFLAQENGGQYISQIAINRGLEPLVKIREAVGMAMDIAIEFHGHWNLPAAMRIADAVREFEPLWLEDIMQPNLDAYNRLSQVTNIPLAISERLFTRYQFLPFIQGRIAGFVNPDVEWCGGISEVKKIASLAETYQLPVSLHNYGGPILNFASAHVSANIPNMALMETGRNLIANWTEWIISKPIVIDDGYMLLPDGPGLGVSLAESLLQRDDLHRCIV